MFEMQVSRMCPDGSDSGSGINSGLTMQLQVLTVLARQHVPPALTQSVLAGRIAEAVAKAEELLGARQANAAPAPAWSELAQLCGDLMLALGRAEEAEETYRQAVKLAGSEQRGTVRVVSCRSTGFLSLHQHRFGTAEACFGRIVVDDAATPPQKVEALCALAMARHGLGHKERALQALDEAGELACSHGSADLAMLASLVRVELMAHLEIRAHEALRDHVFWQSPCGWRPASPDAVQPLAAIEICMAAHGRHALVAARLHHLRDQIRASYGDAGARAALADHIAALRGAGLGALEHLARIDASLVAICHRQSELARAVIEPLHARDGDLGRQPRWGLELSYCLAKVCTLAGRGEEAMAHYQRYALESMQRVRAESALVDRSHRPGAAPATQVKDDVEMRLPAKYRKAYRYMQEHLDCAELSVREIADDMGVTERALQSAFKSHLGMTPGEVIQRCRVERIRADLLREDAPGGTVIETAARWGIRNRSTLITSYRKYFRETPTETLARRGRGEAVAAA
jgi:AraC-like DNA-binding protein